MKLEEARKDYYRRLAREQGYRSRAAFKLLEAITKYKLIDKRDKVLDFGAAPGGWLQVASEAVGPLGAVVGVDLVPVSLREENVRFLQTDVYDASLADTLSRLFSGRADVVLSDLSPKISGTWDLDHFKQAELTLRALRLADALLAEGGNAMLKLFDGERFLELRREAESRFNSVIVMKPRASRSESSEIYLVCLGHRPRAPD